MIEVIMLSILGGVILLGLELFIVPGFIVGLLGFASCGFGVYTSFVEYGNVGGFVALAVVLVLSLVLIAFGLRAKTWRRFSLKENIDGLSQVELEKENISIGDKGMAFTRLAPMGKIMVNGKTYEAKSQDVFIDQKTEVEIVGFDNFTVVVRSCE